MSNSSDRRCPPRLRTVRSTSRPRDVRSASDAGFTLVETLISTLILTIGLVGIAVLLGITVQMHLGARESARSTRLAQDKFDELMKLNFTSDPEVAVGGDLEDDAVGYSESPADGVTVRWAVADGPIPDTRVVTVRVLNEHAQLYRTVDLSTIIRQW